MKNQDFQNRKDEPFGGGVTRVLPLGGKMKKLWVVLRGTLKVTDPGGGVKGNARYPEHPLAGLVKRIRIRTAKAPNSRYPDGLIVDVYGRSLLRRAEFFRKKFLADILTTSNTWDGGATAGLTVNLAFPIFFEQPDMKRPIEYALNCDPTAYKNIQVEIDCGGRDDTFYGNTMTWDTSGLKFDFIDHREGVDGDTYVVFQNDHEYIINGAGDRKEDKNFPVEGALMDAIILAQHGYQMNAAGPSVTLADDVVNEITVSAINWDYDLKREDIHQTMYDYDELDIAQAFVGVYHVNPVIDGMNSKVVPCAGLDMKLNLSNPSGANADSLLLITRRLFQPTGFAPIQPGSKGKNQ